MLPVEHDFLPDSTAFVLVPPERLTAPQIATGLAAWTAARGTRRFPARHDIRPRDIASAMQHMVLLKVEVNDFAFRIVGDGVVRAYDVALQNRKLSEVARDEPGFAAMIIPVLREVTTNGEPIGIHGVVGHDVLRANFTNFEHLLLPLGPDDSTVDHVMVFTSHTTQPFLPKRVTS